MLNEEVCGVGSTFPVQTNERKIIYHLTHRLLYMRCKFDFN